MALGLELAGFKQWQTLNNKNIELQLVLQAERAEANALATGLQEQLAELNTKLESLGAEYKVSRAFGSLSMNHL